VSGYLYKSRRRRFVNSTVEDENDTEFIGMAYPLKELYTAV
jgi:hypothetical protein